MTCREYLDLVSADLDGRLGAEAPAADEHLQTCLGCQGVRRQQQRVRDLLRGRPLLAEAPLGLAARIRVALEEEEAVAGRGAWPWRRALSWSLAGVLAALLIFVARPADHDDSLDPLVRAYVRAETEGPTLFVHTTERGQLESYYAHEHQHGIAPGVVDLSPKGFRLLGGALVPFPDRMARLTAYSDGQRLILCDYQYVGTFPRELPDGGPPLFFTHGGLSFCAQRRGREICLLVTRLPLAGFRKLLAG